MQFTGFKQAKLHRLGSEELHTLRRVACRSFGPRRLIVYTKPDCPLCDGLKDKVSGLIARAQFMPSILTEYILEIRDVSEREEWSSAFAGEVPVLAAELDGVQVKLPRPPPRITAERLQQHIEMALKSNGQP